MLSLLKTRPEVLAFVGAGALLLLGAAAQSWYHLIGEEQPLFSKVLRVVCLLLALLTLSVLVRPRNGAAMLAGIGGITVLLPFLMLLWIGAREPAIMYEALSEQSGADRLVKSITFSDINPQIPWTDNRKWALYPERRNDYTFVEMLEISSTFVKGGWYAALLAGVLLFTGAWVWDGRQARRTLVRHRVAIGASAVLIMAALYGGQVIAHWTFHQAREAYAAGRYTDALSSYRQTMRLDPRFNYDLSFHYELGRLYRDLGMTNEPDYWGTVSDTQAAAGLSADAVKMYQMYVMHPDANPALLKRYVNVLLSDASNDAFNNRHGSAITKFDRALRLDPNNVQIMYGLGMEYMETGSYALAIPVWQKLADANESVNLYKHKYFIAQVYTKPITARAYSNMAYCYKQLGQNKKAMLCYEKSVKQGGAAGSSATGSDDSGDSGSSDGSGG